jgi:hypothetical protein
MDPTLHAPEKYGVHNEMQRFFMSSGLTISWQLLPMALQQLKLSVEMLLLLQT